MKTLRLSIKLEPDTSVAELANLFGDYFTFTPESGGGKYVQFEFKHIRMLTGHSIRGVVRLLEGYEAKKPIAVKMFHLFDDTNKQPAPVFLLFEKDIWQVITTDGAVMNTSISLLKLI